MAMYFTHKYQPQTADEKTLLENNFSNKIEEINNLLDSAGTPHDINNMGPQFDVYFSASKDNTQYYIKPCTNKQEYNLQSCHSYSNGSSSNSSSAYVETNRYARDKGNFKKYPLRSDKSFNVVPNIVENVINERISLKALSIGPDFYYKSDCHTIIDKMKTTVNYLQILSIDRDLLEILVSKFNASCYQLPSCESKRFTINEVCNIKVYYYRAMNLIESEYLSLGKMCVLLAYMSQTVLSNLVTNPKIRKITLHEEKDFQDILNDYLNAMNNLKKLTNLRIIMADNFSQSVTEEEKEQLLAAFDDMTFAIRQWHIMLWTIKEGICMIEITSTEQFEHFRNLFIGS